jgi:hypothetical protein
MTKKPDLVEVCSRLEGELKTAQMLHHQAVSALMKVRNDLRNAEERVELKESRIVSRDNEIARLQKVIVNMAKTMFKDA